MKKITVALLLFVFSVLPAMAGGGLLLLGSEDNSRAEFASSGFTGEDIYECTAGLDCDEASFPGVLYRDEAKSAYDSQGVKKVIINFNLPQDYEGVFVDIDRAGAETTLIYLDGQLYDTVTSSDLSSDEGVWGMAHRTEIGVLGAGDHTLSFMVAEDGEGNGVYAWDYISIGGLVTRFAEITSPELNEYVQDELSLEAYLIDDESDPVSWAVREGTCAAGTNTVWGNVDGQSDDYMWEYDWDTMIHQFNSSVDVSSWNPGMYCFILNPREDTHEDDIRLTREFYVVDDVVSGGGHIIEEMGKKRKDWLDISFGGNLWNLGSSGYDGNWQVSFHNVGENYDFLDKAKFHADAIQAINLYTGNTCEAMNFTVTGTLNNEPGYKLVFRAGDSGNPKYSNGESVDTARVELFNGSQRIYDTHSGSEFTDESNCVGGARTGLDAGNITIK